MPLSTLSTTAISVCLLCAVIAPRPLQAQTDTNPTFEAVRLGMSCQQGAGAATGLACEYRVGRGLRFVITGVGESSAGITVERADGYDSDYYFSFGIGHGCVIVKPGKLAKRTTNDPLPIAFVSPATGNVYHSWEECAAARK